MSETVSVAEKFDFSLVVNALLKTTTKLVLDATLFGRIGVVELTSNVVGVTPRYHLRTIQLLQSYKDEIYLRHYLYKFQQAK